MGADEPLPRVAPLPRRGRIDTLLLEDTLDRVPPQFVAYVLELSFAKTRSRDWDHWARRRTSIVPRPAAARRSGPLISSFALEIWSAGGQQRAKGATVQRRDRLSRPKSRAVTTNSLNPRPSGFANLVQGSKTQRLHRLRTCRAYGFGCGGRI